MHCETCGNELHIDAEACWRCGKYTKHGQVMIQERARAREEEEEKGAELRQIDAELRAEYEKYSDPDADVDIAWGNPDHWLSWGDGDESYEQPPAHKTRTLRLIHKLRELVGEEPDSAILPASFWRILAFLTMIGIIYIVLIGIVVVYFVAFVLHNRALGIDANLVICIALLILLPPYVRRQLRAVRTFGNLKRELRQRRMEELALQRETK